MNFTLSFNEIMPLAPVIIVALTAITVMLLIAIKRNHNLIATTSVLGLNLALIYIVYSAVQATEAASILNMFVIDSFTMFYQVLILVAALACCTLAHAYIETYKENREELYLLMLISVAGAMLMVASTHFAAFFISLELMSIPIYGLVAYTYQRSQSLEAGVKYLVLSATASAMLLMGMAYIYSTLGSLSYTGQAYDMILAAMLTDTPESKIAAQAYIASYPELLNSSLMIIGLGLMIAAIAFKLSLAPFHKWTPDVYAGAPAPIATFLATVSKVAVLAVLVRYLISSGVFTVDSIRTLIIVIATMSILVGNFLAVKQVNLKRILAYSSIAHFGYILLGLLSVSMVSLAAVNVYILTYVLTTIGAFGVVTLMSSPYDNASEAESLADYRGLFWRRPVLTATLTVMMLSLAGIPLTAGFIGKFMVIMATVASGHWFFAAMIIIGSGIGLYYYLRVIVVMYMTPPDMPRMDAQQHWGQGAGGIMVLGAALLVLLLGIYPEPMISIAENLQLITPLQVLINQH